MTSTLEPPIDIDAIPADLRSLPQWTLWRYETVDGRRTKMPYSSRGHRTESNDPRTWLTLETALTLWQLDLCVGGGYFDGIGFVFSAVDGFVGIDLDHCLDADGRLLDWAGPIVAELHGTYAEVSPSGTGIKFWARGSLPTEKTGGRKFSINGQRLVNGCAIELYSRNRYFTLTGNRWGDAPAEIRDCSEAVNELWRKITVEPENGKKTSRANGTSNPPAAVDLNDAKLLEKIRASKNGDRFSQLWAGDIGSYPSHSEADQALCNSLAFWTAGDADRIDLLFRQSGLMRDKWANRDDYRADTIAKAIEGCGGEFYSPKGKGRRKRKRATQSGEEQETSDIEALLSQTSGIVNALQIGDEVLPLSMSQILDHVSKRCDGWPRRVGSALFVPGADGIDWIDRPAALFGYLGSQAGSVDWRRGSSLVTKDEFFAETQRTAHAYLAVESLPHVPPMPRHYYAGPTLEPGNGVALCGLLERFTPATDIDLDLIKAMFATLIWGGQPGARPAFVITSDAGRGAGKTRAAAMLGRLANRIIEFSTGEDAGQIRQRLLTTEGVGARVALLDNVKSLRFSWSELEALITAPIISGKRMYVGEACRPNTLLWIITLNGASLSTDMAQRSVIIKLAKPQRSGTWEEATSKYIDDNRQAILADLVAFFREPAEPLNKFTRWAAWERDVLARLPDPAEAQNVIAERQGVADVEGEEADIIADYFRSRLEDLHYVPRVAVVHIPSGIAAAWLNEATNDRHKVAAASRMLKQLCDEGRLSCIRQNACKLNGRGFLWFGSEATADQPVNYELETKIAELTKPRKS